MPNAHLLLRDVRVDLPGRDTVRDFLAQETDVTVENRKTEDRKTDREGCRFDVRRRPRVTRRGQLLH
jgi:hypothetical protein